MKKKLAIAGAGVTGAYLHRLLRGWDYDIDLFDVPPTTRCGLHPCAWGTSAGFHEMAASAGLKGDQYILARPNHVLMDEIPISAELMTIDKPRFIRDLLSGADINRTPLDISRYDRVIDATGAARAFLPTVEDDIVLVCVQSRIRTEEPLGNRIKLGRIGYAWCFPLANDEYHIGCGSLRADPKIILADLGWLESPENQLPRKIVCRCSAPIRLTGPHGARPFCSSGPPEGVWGVGEAIGCVAPLAGDGIVPGMRSARLLIDHWQDPEAYSQSVLKEFSWMKDERRVLDKLRHDRRLGLSDAWVLKKNSRRMNIHVGLKAAVKLLARLK